MGILGIHVWIWVNTAGIWLCAEDLKLLSFLYSLSIFSFSELHSWCSIIFTYKCVLSYYSQYFPSSCTPTQSLSLCLFPSPSFSLYHLSFSPCLSLSIPLKRVPIFFNVNVIFFDKNNHLLSYTYTIEFYLKLSSVI